MYKKMMIWCVEKSDLLHNCFIYTKYPSSLVIIIFSNGLQSDSDASDHNQDSEDSNNCDLERCSSGAPAYKRLIAIHAGKPKGGLKEQLKVEIDKVRRLSLSEQGLEKATMNHATDVVRYLNFLNLDILKQFSLC